MGMRTSEITKILDFIGRLPASPEGDEVAATVMRLAADSATLKAVQNRAPSEPHEGRFIKFTNKEIDTMPEKVKQFLIINNKMITYREIRGLYQVRYHRDGFSIEVASKDFDTMKRKFLAKLAEQQEHKPNKLPLFKDFVKEWLTFKKPMLKDNTYKSYVDMITSQLLPAFGDWHLGSITRKDVQDFLNKLVEEGKNRTAQKVKQTLGAIFDLACEDYDLKSPMSRVVLPHYEVQKGSPLSVEEEKRLIEACKENPHLYGNSAVLVLLYTGMRVGELPSMEMKEENGYRFIECTTEKTRKGYADVRRRIPISPMLKRVWEMIDVEKAKAASKECIRDTFKAVFPDRHPHELRYTFISRCKEHGCNLELVMLWDGHQFDKDVASSKVDRGYTQYSDAFYFGEIEKVNYDL